MIEIEHLSFSFSKKTVLHDVSAVVADGTLCAVLGANGSGKTTLLRCISNQLVPQQGRVVLDGKDVRDYSTRGLSLKLSLVRQHAHTDFEFSAFEIVLMGRNPYQSHLQNESRQDLDIVERCMKQTNTWHLRFSRFNEMSGGELQRVMIARALAQQTPVMLLDEPISSLDIAHQYDIMVLLRDISQNQHKTVLLVVHDLNMALQYCPQLILLHKGGILYQGDTEAGLTPDNIERVFGMHAKLQNGHILLYR